MSIPFHDKLVKRLQEVISAETLLLATAPSVGADAYGDYRERAGRIKGIIMATEEADLLETKILES